MNLREQILNNTIDRLNAQVLSLQQQLAQKPSPIVFTPHPKGLRTGESFTADSITDTPEVSDLRDRFQSMFPTKDIPWMSTKTGCYRNMEYQRLWEAFLVINREFASTRKLAVFGAKALTCVLSKQSQSIWLELLALEEKIIVTSTDEMHMPSLAYAENMHDEIQRLLSATPPIL